MTRGKSSENIILLTANGGRMKILFKKFNIDKSAETKLVHCTSCASIRDYHDNYFGWNVMGKGIAQRKTKG